MFSSLDDEAIDTEFFDLASATSPLAGRTGLSRPGFLREVSTAPAVTSYVPSMFPAATPVEPILGELNRVSTCSGKPGRISPMEERGEEGVHKT